MNGRYLIVTRMAAVLVTAFLFVVGCDAGEARAPGSEGGAAGGDTATRPAMGPRPIEATAGSAERPDASTPVPRPTSEPGSPANSGATAAAHPAAGTPGTVTSTAEPSRTTNGTTADQDASTAAQDPSPSGQAASPDEILRATSRAYEGLRSFRAGFEQTLQNTLIGRTTTSSGTLYQRQPDRFLMEFSDPPNDLIVSDGDYFWMYFPSVDAKQVLRTPRGGQGLDLRAQFVGDPVRRFESTYHGTESVRGRQSHVMTLVPRESLGYSRLKVWIDAADHLVRRFELTEGNGNIRHFELRDLVANPTLPDDLFEFTPPPGTQVVTR